MHAAIAALSIASMALPEFFVLNAASSLGKLICKITVAGLAYACQQNLKVFIRYIEERCFI